VSKPFSLAARLGSFRHALAGLATLLREEHNARIHLLATVVVLGLAGWLDVSRGEWLALLFAIALVWLAEAMNTALEHLCDALVPEPHQKIARAKDVAAAGVLICAAVAAVVGALVFLPYFWRI
jgi:diacylglycerol kinase (ATP)